MGLFVPHKQRVRQALKVVECAASSHPIIEICNGIRKPLQIDVSPRNGELRKKSARLPVFTQFPKGTISAS
jgi:hypothetical protein